MQQCKVKLLNNFCSIVESWGLKTGLRIWDSKLRTDNFLIVIVIHKKVKDLFLFDNFTITWMFLLQLFSDVVAQKAEGENRADSRQGSGHALVEAPEEALVFHRLGNAVPHAVVHCFVTYKHRKNIIFGL
jgi:hypothetical protein